MNIIFLIGQLRYSGAENVLRCIAPAIAQKGHNVEIMVMTKGFENEALPNVTISYYGAEGNAVQRRLGRYKKIRERVREMQADIVVGFGFPMNFDAIFGVAGTSAKSVICERMDPYTSKQTLSFRVQKKLFYPLANGYAVQTPSIKEYYQKHFSGKKQVAVIPNPVRRCWDEVQTPDEGVEDYLITVGRLDDAQKNQTMLINAFKMICNDFPSLKLYLAGSGNDLEKYKSLCSELGIEERVVFLGNVADPTEVVKNARIFLLTSNHEGMPNALIEAMAQGKPCISTRCSGGGAEYLIEQDKNGILIDRGDVTDCAAKIRELLNDEAKCSMLSENALKINQRLALDTITDEWVSCFKKVVKLEK